MSDAAELKALAGETYTVKAAGKPHEVSVLRVKQLASVIERSTTVLPLIAARADELESDPAATLADLVVDSAPGLSIEAMTDRVVQALETRPDVLERK